MSCDSWDWHNVGVHARFSFFVFLVADLFDGISQKVTSNLFEHFTKDGPKDLKQDVRSLFEPNINQSIPQFHISFLFDVSQSFISSVPRTVLGLRSAPLQSPNRRASFC